MRRAAVVIATGAFLLSGGAVYGSAQAQEAQAQPAQAQETPSANGPAVQAATLREAAAAQGRFVGTAIADGKLSNTTYTNIARTEFDSVTAENVMKWDTLEPSRNSFNYAPGDRLVNFAQANDQQIYGHTLVWHSQLPSWVTNGGFNATELNSVMTNHITNVVTHYRDSIEYWDVVNEVFNEDGTLRGSVFQNTIGQGYIANAFRAARAADPDAKLCINDYNVEGTNAKSNGLYNLVSSLLNQGVPIDCVGLQSHFILDQIPSTLQANMQRFANLGLEVNITELDIRMTLPADSAKLSRQATQYASVVGTCLAVANCGGITVWGFGDVDSWIPGVFDGQGAACLYDNNYAPKPAYNAMLTAFGGEPGGEDPGDPGEPPVTGCVANYQVTSRWNAGSVVNVSVTTAQAVTGWAVTFNLPSGESVTNSWNTALSQSGAAVTARNASYNGSVGAGGSFSFGFQTNSGAVYSAPVLTLNGTVCTAS
ncbi:endo-1,4-beta-xylanase [Streptomyces hainanensis]|uniref:endo-1,4-beta-xylanase n=1 Tax=Streptomyces hainanensis TaxID=402648 RepID=UPI001FB643F1|nr:endo-1,4-beta-xylanase [Streptomyces hainanensis]